MNDSGTASAAISSAAIAATNAIRTKPSSGSTTLVSQAYPAQVHQSRTKTNSPCPSPSQVGLSTISAVHWVSARTKTRSKKSSSGITRSPSRITALSRRVGASTCASIAGMIANGGDRPPPGPAPPPAAV